MRKNTCSNCGEHLEINRTRKYRYCKACHAQWMREHRPKHKQLNDEQRRKANARSYAKVYQKRGQIKKAPCEICGSENSEKHHEDYSQPLKVNWLCRKCHLELHRKTA